MLTKEHPLRACAQELYGHRWCLELALQPLSETALEEYLFQRFPQSAFPTQFAPTLFERTGGNPLFLATLLDTFIERELLVETNGTWSFQLPLSDLPIEVPDNLRHLLSGQKERLAQPEQVFLEASSIAGMEFSAAAVAAALDIDIVDAEKRGRVLADRQIFLRPAGLREWPDGTHASCYRFRHALYQQFLHEQVTPTQRQLWHKRIGARLETAYQQRTGEIAGELAIHFEHGRDSRRTLTYLLQAGQTATQRAAYHSGFTSSGCLFVL